MRKAGKGSRYVPVPLSAIAEYLSSLGYELDEGQPGREATYSKATHSLTKDATDKFVVNVTDADAVTSPST